MWKHLEQQRLHYIFSKLVSLIFSIGIEQLQQQQTQILYRLHDEPIKDSKYCLEVQEFIAYLRDKYREIKVVRNQQKFFDKKELHITLATVKRRNQKEVLEKERVEKANNENSSPKPQYYYKSKKNIDSQNAGLTHSKSSNMFMLQGCRKTLIEKPPHAEPRSSELHHLKPRISESVNGRGAGARPSAKVNGGVETPELWHVQTAQPSHNNIMMPPSSRSLARRQTQILEFPSNKSKLTSRRSVGFFDRRRKSGRVSAIIQADTMKKDTNNNQNASIVQSLKGWIESQRSSIIGDLGLQHHTPEQIEKPAQIGKPGFETLEQRLKNQKKRRILDVNFWVSPFQNKFIDEQRLRDEGDILPDSPLCTDQLVMKKQTSTVQANTADQGNDKVRKQRVPKKRVDFMLNNTRIGHRNFNNQNQLSVTEPVLGNKVDSLEQKQI